MRSRLKTSGLALSALFALAGCAKDVLSERDSLREQYRNNAETKRRELEQVVGEYRGTLTQPKGPSQRTLLRLEIKTVPLQVEGKVDPVMMPVLTGYMRFEFGPPGEGAEFIGFGVQKADYDPKRLKLDFVVSNADSKDVLFSLDRASDTLRGTWVAKDISASGSAELVKVKPGETPVGQERLRGEYTGTFLRDKDGLYQFGHLTLGTSVLPPEGLKVTATLRLIFGQWGSTEYLTYRFDQAQFNPITGQLLLRSPTADLIFNGSWENGELKGDWTTIYTGRVGVVSLKKQKVPETPGSGAPFEALQGTYQGRITNTNPKSELAERLQVSFVTSQDLEAPNGIRITGSARLYEGPFGSGEYFEYPFGKIEFNFFTRTLVAKTTGDLKITIKGAVNHKQVTGTIESDGLGEMAVYAMEKK